MKGEAAYRTERHVAHRAMGLGRRRFNAVTSTAHPCSSDRSPHRSRLVSHCRVRRTARMSCLTSPRPRRRSRIPSTASSQRRACTSAPRSSRRTSRTSRFAAAARSMALEYSSRTACWRCRTATSSQASFASLAMAVCFRAAIPRRCRTVASSSSTRSSRRRTSSNASSSSPAEASGRGRAAAMRSRIASSMCRSRICRRLASSSLIPRRPQSGDP